MASSCSTDTISLLRTENGAELADELIQREYRRLLKCNALKERKGQMHLLLDQLEASSEQRRTIGRD